MADDSSNGFLWFLAGLGIGAAVGVLYAPKAGRETREDILRAAEDGRELVRDRARQYRNQAGEWVDRGKDVVSQQKEQRRADRHPAEPSRQAYREATTESETTPKL